MPDAAAWLFHDRAPYARSQRSSGRRGRHRLGIRDAFGLDPGQAERAQAALASDQWVADLLEGLAPDQQDAVRARILDERPYREIAERMQTSELVIRQRVSRGLASLRARLEEPS